MAVCVLGSSLQATVCKSSCPIRMTGHFSFMKSVIGIVVCFEAPGVCSLQTNRPEKREM